MAMTEQAAAARREYKRRWNKENKDKVKAAQERYWNKIAAEKKDEPKKTQEGKTTDDI